MAATHRRSHARRSLRGIGRARARRRARSRCSTRSSISPRPRFASRLPQTAQGRRSAQHGIRNSHLLSIAPTGTISLAFADNASQRHRAAVLVDLPAQEAHAATARMKAYDVEDHAWRLYRHLRRRRGEAAAARSSPRSKFPRSITCAWSPRSRPSSTPRSARRSTCPKTIRTSSSRIFTLEAWKSGLKGITTYRPNTVLGSVLSIATPAEARTPNDLDTSDADRRIRLEAAPTAGAVQPALAGSAEAAARATRRGPTWWNRRSASSRSSSATSRTASRIRSRCGSTATSSRAASARWRRRCRWTCAPQDAAWLRMKLDMLARTAATTPSIVRCRPTASRCACRAWWRRSRASCAIASISWVRWRSRRRLAGARRVVREEGAEDRHRRHHVVDRRRLQSELGRRLRADPQGARAAERAAPAVFGVDGGRVSARARRAVQAALARHARHRSGLDRHEAAQASVTTPSRSAISWRACRASERQENYPSTVAYVARLIIHRYAMLGVLDERGYPVSEMGVLRDAARTIARSSAPTLSRPAGQAVRGMRKRGGDQQGRLRVLHGVRCHRRLRLTSVRPG